MLDYIENNMARLMDGPAAISSSSDVPDHTFPAVVEKVLAIIESFIGKEEPIIGKIIETCKNPDFEIRGMPTACISFWACLTSFLHHCRTLFSPAAVVLLRQRCFFSC